MAKRAKQEDKIKTRVTFPKFKTLGEQTAFQIGLALSFNTMMRILHDTNNSMLMKGEEILKDMGMEGIDVLEKLRGGDAE